MIKQIIILIFTCACINTQAQVNIIKSIAGCDTNNGYGGDGGAATNAKLFAPEAVHLDWFGNLYIADAGNSRIRKVKLSTGIITTVAGSNSYGSSGDGGPATNAQLDVPVDVFTNDAGDIFIADMYKIRKVTIATGIITTVAGNGVAGFSGDGGPATNAELNGSSGVCVDKHGNIFIADYLNERVRKVDAATGIITTVAGTGVTGFSGNGGPATNAKFNGPEKVFVDTIGNIFISDQFNSEVRKVDAVTGIVTNVAGRGTDGYSGDGGPAVNAQLSQPGGLFVDVENNLFFAEYTNGIIRKVDGATGIISTVAGTGHLGFSGDGGPATDARLIPDGVYVDSAGIVYIADYNTNHIRVVFNPQLAVTSVSHSPEVSIYPSPADNELTIEHGANNKIIIIDVFGKVIATQQIYFDKEIINISTFSNGLYFAQFVGSSGERTTVKFVKL